MLELVACSHRAGGNSIEADKVQRRIDILKEPEPDLPNTYESYVRNNTLDEKVKSSIAPG